MNWAIVVVSFCSLSGAGYCRPGYGGARGGLFATLPRGHGILLDAGLSLSEKLLRIILI